MFPYEGDDLEDDFEEDDDDDYEYVDPDRQIAYFWSTRRQVTAEEISEILKFADRVLREYDAYVPDFNDVYFLGEVPTLGKTYRIQNRELG